MLLFLFTQFHVAISLVALALGVALILKFWKKQFPRTLNVSFLTFTIATSVTGFFFPFHGITPGIILGVASLVVLTFGVVSWNKRWLKSYMTAAIVAEYLNVIVLIVQLFQKVPPLHVFAPKGSEPIVAVCQLLSLAAFVAAGVVAFKRYRQREIS